MAGKQITMRLISRPVLDRTGSEIGNQYRLPIENFPRTGSAAINSHPKLIEHECPHEIEPEDRQELA